LDVWRTPLQSPELKKTREDTLLGKYWQLCSRFVELVLLLFQVKTLAKTKTSCIFALKIIYHKDSL
jgi:hypothetical protein